MVASNTDTIFLVKKKNFEKNYEMYAVKSLRLLFIAEGCLLNH